MIRLFIAIGIIHQLNFFNLVPIHAVFLVNFQIFSIPMSLSYCRSHLRKWGPSIVLPCESKHILSLDAEKNKILNLITSFLLVSSYIICSH